MAQSSNNDSTDKDSSSAMTATKGPLLNDSIDKDSSSAMTATKYPLLNDSIDKDSSSTMTAIKDPLLQVIQKAFPDVHSYEVDDNIVQANAEGFGVTVKSNDSDRCLFVKTVEASKYSHKPWGDLRRTLLYARTEARFYSDILPMLQKKSSSDWSIAPYCHLSATYLDGLIEEHESTSAKEGDSDSDPVYDESEHSILIGKGGNLILDSMKEGYYQDSPLKPEEAVACLTAIAKFHALGFQDEEILSKVSDNLCEYGGSYHLKNRNPKEIKNLQTTWENFVKEISPANEELFTKQSIQDLAQRMQNMAEYISNELSPSHKDKYATIVHGDFKSMNVFLPTTDKDHPVIIDFASTGLGNPLSDVAMHITHALDPEHLVDGGEEAMVDAYINALNDALPDGHFYPRDDAFRHYQLAVLDYFRFIMGRLWRGSTLDTFEKRKNSKNSVYVNRSLDAAFNFIERADKYLERFEKEVNERDEL
ncbi:hypothetical protein CTEN210_16965 [Chaetoceros tenuissimus]|uniref:CHK kinase-like domain-containing protein n=1 Tax=Chaetoceros tenuissimus TaxID=426638 RepID=A0AAD3D9V1_9STRA|nr:hypothetical protein CTEN210_16965 [Chaetoceros tenuissimus]